MDYQITSSDFGDWGSFLSGLSTFFTGMTLFIIITNDIKSKKEDSLIRDRENIRFILTNIPSLNKLKINVIQYCEIALHGNLAEQNITWIQDHESSVKEMKDLLLYIYKLIQNQSIEMAEKNIYRWNLFEAFSDDERDAIMKIYNHPSIHWLMDRKVYYLYGLY